MKHRFPQGAMMRFTLCLLALLAPVALLHAQAITNGTYTLTPQNATALRLDDEAASTATGNPIDVYTANGTAAQNWATTDTGVTPAGYYTLSTEGAYCLTASGTASGSAVVLDPCAGSSAQAWEAVKSGSFFVFHPANNTANCLDVTGAGTASGTLVQVYTCNGTTAQEWSGPTASGGGEGPYPGPSAPAIPGTVMSENYDTGGQGVAYNVTSTNGTANTYRSQGVDLEAASAPATGNDLGWSAAGQWFKYTVNASAAGTYKVSFLVASPAAVGDAFHISNSSGTNLSGSVAVPATGGYQTWVTVTANVTLPAGTQTLTLNEDAAGWNIDSMAFAAGSSSCTSTPSAPTGLAASGTTSTGTTLNWTADSAPANCSISSYTVLKNGASIGTATGTSFAVSGLAASTNYSFTVEATDAAGTSAASSAVSVTTSAASGGEAPYPGPSAAAVPGTVMAENYDTGGQGVAYNVTSTNGTANTYRAQGVDLEAATAPATGNDLGWSAAGQWFRYTVNAATAGSYTVSFLVASPAAVADAFHLSNSSGINLTGSVAVPATGGYQTWVTVTATVTLPAGTQTLTLSEDAAGWNIDSIGFAAVTTGEGPYPGPSAPAIPGTVLNENYDTGGQGVAYNVTSTNGTANTYRAQGVDLEAATAPATGNDLGWSAAGQWFKYTVNASTAGAYTVSFLVASPAAVGDAFHLSNSSGTNLTGSVNVPATGGYQTWTTVTATVTLSAGQQTLTLNEDAAGWNIDSMAFSSGTSGSSFPPGIPVSQYLVGENDWYSLPDAVWPVVKASDLKFVRIGGAGQDYGPLPCDDSEGDLIQQIQMIRSAGAEPLIEVSRVIDGGNTSQLAAAAAAMVTCVNVTYVNNGTLTKPVQFWEIGNEPDLNYTGTDDQLAAYVSGYVTAIAPAMRNAYSNITILAPALSYYHSTAYGDLLGGSYDISGTDSSGRYYINGVSVHTYPFAGSQTFSQVLSYETSGFPGMVSALIGNINSANSKHGRTGANAMTYAVDEFNMDYANPSTNGPANLGVCGFINGQLFASFFGTGMDLATSAGYSALSLDTWSINEGGGECAGGDLGFLTGDPGNNPTPRSSYYHMQMVGQYLLSGSNPGYLQPTSSNTGAGVLAIATSSNAGAQLAVMILNEDENNSHSFSLRMNTAAVQGPGDTKINVPANLAVEYSDTIATESTMVLVFNTQGQLMHKTTYSLGNYESNQAPQVVK